MINAITHEQACVFRALEKQPSDFVNGEYRLKDNDYLLINSTGIITHFSYTSEPGIQPKSKWIDEETAYQLITKYDKLKNFL